VDGASFEEWIFVIGLRQIAQKPELLTGKTCRFSLKQCLRRWIKEYEQPIGLRKSPADEKNPGFRISTQKRILQNVIRAISPYDTNDGGIFIFQQRSYFLKRFGDKQQYE
jgi:hypothetical protein